MGAIFRLTRIRCRLVLLASFNHPYLCISDQSYSESLAKSWEWTLQLQGLFFGTDRDGTYDQSPFPFLGNVGMAGCTCYSNLLQVKLYGWLSLVLHIPYKWQHHKGFQLLSLYSEDMLLASKLEHQVICQDRNLSVPKKPLFLARVLLIDWSQIADRRLGRSFFQSQLCHTEIFCFSHKGFSKLYKGVCTHINLFEFLTGLRISIRVILFRQFPELVSDLILTGTDRKFWMSKNVQRES